MNDEFERIMRSLQARTLNNSRDPKICERNLALFEKSVGATLPGDYRDFVGHWGECAFSISARFPIAGETPFGNEVILDVIFGFFSGGGYSVTENFRLFSNLLPSDSLPVAQDPGGNLVCLQYLGEGRGAVWFLELQDSSSRYRVASDWSEFIRILYSRRSVGRPD